MSDNQDKIRRVIVPEGTLKRLILDDNKIEMIHARLDKFEERLDALCQEHSEFDKEMSMRLEGINTSLDFIKEAMNKDSNGKTKSDLIGLVRTVLYVVLVLVAIIFGIKGAEIWKILTG